MIHELSVTNFKSLKNVSLKLGQRNVLVGPNLCGKSNLIQSLRLLCEMVRPGTGSYGLPNAVMTLGGFSEVSWKGSEPPGPISILVTGTGRPFTNFGGGAKWEYQITIVGGPAGVPRVQDESLWVESNGEHYTLIERVEGDRKFKNTDGHVISAVGNPDRTALEFEIPDWDGNELRKFLQSFQFFSLIPQLMRSPNQAAAADFLMEHGDNFSSWMMTLQTKHEESFQRIARVAKDAFPGLERVFTVPTQHGQVSVTSQERYLKKPVPLYQMSDGELAFVALLSLIFSPSELAAPLYCIEEPGNHLHPWVLSTLVEVLRQVQGEFPPEQCPQVVITTHSPYLVDQFSLDELIVLEKREGATIAVRPSDRSHLQDLFRSGEIGLGELFYSGALSRE